ncbi:MAG: TatD family hydrolase [Muribaculaceae bacterium]|nr:TatD family hydrolase [Muribaculaceae bacterium]
MTRCLDIHTHHAAPQPQAVISASFEDFNPMEGQLYSLGIHPWTPYKDFSSQDWADYLLMAAQPCVVAIGECGIDKVKGGPLFNQLLIMKKQIEMSEVLHKPLIIHDVKAHDVITGLKRDMQPTQKWMVHGFRNKPSVAKMLTDAGIYLSFGELFNPEVPTLVPKELILAETDESPLTIEEIIARLSSNLGEDITELIAANTASFLYSNTDTNETAI